MNDNATYFAQVHIRVSIAEQVLRLYNGENLSVIYSVSTGLTGAGEMPNSGMTPRGMHEIIAKIGMEAPINQVFVARRPTSELYSPKYAATQPSRDWMLTRILWLGGLEPGKNRFHERDTKKRYIYLHGTPDETELGRPGSHGCVRMRNEDVIALFDRVTIGTRVYIE